MPDPTLALKPTPAPTRKRKAPKKRKRGKPTVWTAKLKDAIVDTLEQKGCSFEDAAVFNGIAYETLKARQRVDAAYSARLARARTNLKVKTLGKIHEAVQSGSVHAATWWLEKVYPDEYGRRVELSGGLEGLGSAPPAASVTTNNVTQIVLGDKAARDAHDDFLAAIAGGTRSPQLTGGSARGSDAQQPDSVDALPISSTDQPVSARGRSRPN